MGQSTDIMQDEVLNTTLKKMWRIDNQLKERLPISNEDRLFYKDNIKLILNYYESNARYWAGRAGEPIYYKGEKLSQNTEY